MRILLAVAIAAVGCGQTSNGADDLAELSDMSQRPGADLTPTTDGAPPSLHCSWTLSDPAASGTVAVTPSVVVDGQTQCVVTSNALELRVPRANGDIDDFTISVAAPGSMRLYRLIAPGRAVPEITCQTWTGSIMVTAAAPKPVVQFDLTCSDIGSGYTYWDMFAPTTHIAGSIMVD